MNKPTGLVNLGNTCFLNSCIQVLNQIHEIDSFLENTISHLKQETHDALIYKEWYALKKFMEKTPGAVSPVRFVHYIHKIAESKNRDIFTGWAQNDVSEFLLFVVDSLHTSISRGVKIKIKGKTENDTDKLALSCYRMMRDVYQKEYSEFMDLFYGVSVSQILSLDGQKIYSQKPEMYFILDLPICSMNKTLYGSFDKYMGHEILDGENMWFNPSTGKKEEVKKQTLFFNFPKVLVLTINRFMENEYQKNNDLIQFPLENLDLSKYIIGYSPDSYQYDLFGVCNHIGGFNGGHYTSFIKNNMGKWYHMNDMQVDEIYNSSSIITPMAYCLFYRKKNRAL